MATEETMVPAQFRRPLLLVISAPSGGGKSTLCNRLLRERPEIVYSISCTTRAPRGGEVNGRDYHFLAEVEFARRVQAGEFLEHAVVHGHRYGTLRAPVVAALQTGRDVLMDIDVQGAAQIRENIAQRAETDFLRQAFLDVFVVPPSLRVLRERLERRGEDAPNVIERRLRTAEQEVQRWREYRYLIINDRLDDAFAQLCAIVTAERCRIVT